MQLLSRFNFTVVLISEIMVAVLSTQDEVPDRNQICPDRNERTKGVSCVQNYTVWKHG